MFGACCALQAVVITFRRKSYNCSVIKDTIIINIVYAQRRLEPEVKIT